MNNPNAWQPETQAHEPTGHVCGNCRTPWGPSALACKNHPRVAAAIQARKAAIKRHNKAWTVTRRWQEMAKAKEASSWTVPA